MFGVCEAAKTDGDQQWIVWIVWVDRFIRLFEFVAVGKR
jgi:hypothetical protein